MYRICWPSGRVARIETSGTLKEIFPEIEPRLFDNFKLKTINLIIEDGTQISIHKIGEEKK
jgi:hypothetical protein